MSECKVKKMLYELRYSFPTNNDPPSNAREFINWLNGIICLAPLGFRDSVEIEIDSRVEYDSSSHEINVFYYRPETEKEIKAREDYRQAMADREIALAMRILANNGIIVP